MNWDKLLEKLQELKDHPEMEIRDLETIRVNIVQSIDESLEDLYKKKDEFKKLIQEKINLKQFKVGFFRQLLNLKIRQAISAPFIYSMIIPLVITDIFLEVYHRICFPLYGIPIVRRSDYISYDRHLLSYLNWFERFNCMYCSYANGLIAYVREVAARTERYWCPIKHSKKLKGEHSQYHLFSGYLEGENYHENQERLRKF